MPNSCLTTLPQPHGIQNLFVHNRFSGKSRCYIDQKLGEQGGLGLWESELEESPEVRKGEAKKKVFLLKSMGEGGDEGKDQGTKGCKVGGSREITVMALVPC